MTNKTRGKRWFGALSVVATIATVGASLPPWPRRPLPLRGTMRRQQRRTEKPAVMTRAGTRAAISATTAGVAGSGSTAASVTAETYVSASPSAIAITPPSAACWSRPRGGITPQFPDDDNDSAHDDHTWLLRPPRRWRRPPPLRWRPTTTTTWHLLRPLRGSDDHDDGAPSPNCAAALSGTALSRTGWVASTNSASAGSDLPANALDGNLATRFSTDQLQTPGLRFEVNMGSPQTFNELVMEVPELDHGLRQGLLWSRSPMTASRGATLSAAPALDRPRS